MDARSFKRLMASVVVTALALYLVIGVVIWGWLIIDGRPVPAAFGNVLSAIAGGFLSFLGSVYGRRSEHQG